MNPPAPGWNVGNNNPSHGIPASNPTWNSGYGRPGSGGYGTGGYGGGYGNNYGGGYGHQSLPTYGSPPPAWGSGVGNFAFGNRMGGMGGGYGGNSKTGLLAAAGAGAATVAGVWYLSNALSPSRHMYGHGYNNNYNNGYYGHNTA